MNALTASFKKLTTMWHGGGSGLVGWLGFMRGGGGGSGRINYRRKVGSLLDASVVMAPVQWVQRAVPEATLVVKCKKKDGGVDLVPEHPMLALIQKPNDFYADIVLWWGVVLSLLLDGNAYLLIIRNDYGQPAELWYVPHWMIEPKKWPGSKGFIDYYLYSPGGVAPIEVAPEDVVHFRHGLNPNNMMKGLAPLEPAIREIFMDNESSEFVSALLNNGGVPGVVIAPKGGAMASPGDVDATKAWFIEQFSGSNRGKPLVMGAATEVHQYGFNPGQMDMGGARDIAEERVCALIGVAPAVVGFGAGLQSTKVGATMDVMERSSWRIGVLPLLRLIADELQRSLLPLFARSDGLSVDWDTDEVKALQEDEDKLAERWSKMVAGRLAMVSEAREAMGLETDESHKIFLCPMSLMEIPAGETQASVEAASVPAAIPARSPQALLPAKGRKHNGDDGHDHPPEDKPRASAEAIKRGRAYVRMLQRQESRLSAAVQKPLKALFAELGAAAGKAAAGEVKAVKADDDAAVQAILAKLGIGKWQNRLKAVYIAHYEAALKAANEAANSAGIEGPLPDEVARSVIAAGGRRAAMVDLDKQTRDAIFDALAEGREAGEGAEALASRIVGMVEAGPWGSAETRARVIARTETKYAQNVSTIERAKAGGVEQFVVFDGRLGPGRSKPDHIARDGTIVSAAEADAMAAAEHPNGTLSFAPHFDF